MKKLLLLSAIVLHGIISFAAKITVDNTPGSAANYSSLPAAITAALSGDTILVYGSSYNYGGIGITDKKLTLVGSAGFDPEVSNENTPTLSNVSISGTQNGTTITGFTISYVQVDGAGITNLGIYNNRFSGTYGVWFYYANASNVIIEGNVFQSNGQNSFIENYSNTSTLNNILVKNNYFEMVAYHSYMFQYNNSAFTYRNNVFIARSCCGYTPFNASSNVLFENNIFWFTDAAFVDITGQNCLNCVFNNNIIYNSGGATMTAINAIGNGVSGANNILNQNPDFVNFNVANNYTIAENYAIADSSLGNNAGTDGSDIGLFGGNYKWENRKYPKAFPHQEVLNVINSSVPQGTPVNINLKARKASN
jgi:hypothetical protein